MDRLSEQEAFAKYQRLALGIQDIANSLAVEKALLRIGALQTAEQLSGFSRRQKNVGEFVLHTLKVAIERPST